MNKKKFEREFDYAVTTLRSEWSIDGDEITYEPEGVVVHFGDGYFVANKAEFFSPEKDDVLFFLGNKFIGRIPLRKIKSVEPYF